MGKTFDRDAWLREEKAKGVIPPGTASRPERIHKILGKLEIIWQAYPQWTFAELVVSVLDLDLNSPHPHDVLYTLEHTTDDMVDRSLQRHWELILDSDS